MNIFKFTKCRKRLFAELLILFLGTPLLVLSLTQFFPILEGLALFLVGVVFAPARYILFAGKALPIHRGMRYILLGGTPGFLITVIFYSVLSFLLSWIGNFKKDPNPKGILERAKILVEALPYIREFHGKVIVIKCGGELMASEEVKKNISQDVALMKFVGIKPIIIHGGGPQVTELLEKQGKKAEFIEGMRKTDEETLGVVEKVLAEVNEDFVKLISEEGAQAIGFSGGNGKLIKAKKLTSSKGEDLGMVGEVAEIDSSKINEVEEKGLIPVIAPLGEENGNILNINADIVASDIAVALKAEKMMILTNKPGIMKDICDDNSLISSVSLSEIDSLIEKGIIHGGMLPKIKACKKAITEGVNKTHIIDGRVEHCILLEIFTDKGVGTQITK